MPNSNIISVVYKKKLSFKECSKFRHSRIQCVLDSWIKIKFRLR